MKIGTKSVLFGAHQFLLHPWFVAAAWTKLYGFPCDPRLWMAFFIHDWGYWNMPNMDGPEGEEHPWLGARIMGDLFDEILPGIERWGKIAAVCNRIWGFKGSAYWHNLAFYHSRFMCKRYGAQFSRLCVADKLAVAFTPWWLYLPMVNLTGEIHEYMALAEKREGDVARKYSFAFTDTSNQKRWYLSVQSYLRDWVNEHKDMRPDTWTPDQRQEAAVGNGVWK